MERLVQEKHFSKLMTGKIERLTTASYYKQQTAKLEVLKVGTTVGVVSGQLACSFGKEGGDTEVGSVV